MSAFYDLAFSAPISIHALLAESDVNTADQEARKRLISIHALLAESDERANSLAHAPPEFLSTLSLRRATDIPPNLDADHAISIHALLAESDTGKSIASNFEHAFLSTLSLRRATR